MFKEFKQHIIANNFISEEKHLLTAVSGGVDSMVLLHMLTRLRADIKLQLSVIHIQHHLRSDAEEDAQLVQNYCTGSGIDYYRVDLDPKSRPKSQSVEAWARSKRLSHIYDLKKEINADSILTAHHADDHLETILMHLSEGTGLNGLKGIREKWGDIIRPMLRFSKIEIEAYANTHNIQYRQDSTNTDTSHPRNFLRHEIIPNWKRQYPQLISAVQNLTANLSEVSEIVYYTLEEVSNKVVDKSNPDQFILNLSKFKDEPESLKVHLVKYLLNQDIPWRKHNWQDVRHLINNGQTGSMLEIGDYDILKNRDSLIIRKRAVVSSEHFEIHLGDVIHSNKFTFVWKNTENYKTNDNQNVEIVDGETLQSELELRPWQNGDYFQPLGMIGHKKVSDFLIDTKMDRFSKQSQYVLAVNNEVLWVCGKRISEKVKVTPETTQFAELSFHQNVG